METILTVSLRINFIVSTILLIAILFSINNSLIWYLSTFSTHFGVISFLQMFYDIRCLKQ